MKSYMKLSYQIILDELRKRLPQFVVANAVVHLDEDTGDGKGFEGDIEDRSGTEEIVGGV